MERTNAVARIGALVGVGILACGLAWAGIAGAGASQALAEETTQVDALGMIGEWKVTYPNEYASYATHYFAEGGAEQSHYMFRYKQAAAADAETRTGACISCKSSLSNELYEEYGDDFFQMSVASTQAEELITYWDCQSCHTSLDDLTVSPNLVVFNTLAGDAFADVDDEILVCGQCHNSAGAWTYAVSADAPLDSWDPYRYGTDADAMYQAYTEDGHSSFTDEATGAYLSSLSYDDLEMYVGSTHYSMGLTCVDCHMTETVDEDGAEFTSHNASSSPLENPEALELCLTCHSAQGIETEEDMVQFFYDTADELSAAMDEAIAAEQELAAVLTEATAQGVEGDAIDAAREDYAKAYFFKEFVDSYRVDGNYRVAHNADYMMELAARMLQLSNEGLALMAE